ncbi:sigma factor-like helix-turn-helix DNA-binding protein [Lihuaxuella thermophila]|uniref:Sigma-70, region 4 n=1 Tax=Lihuaxuella thermophila TaxID=1173111 RepID=A0A1H8HBA4_9BACL|nr:sigma factor-like helix-turn-helix DNA-binding protein [Lihuaxuella thermophila]SEN53533.1 Sigma-70, region 4 [Lihuaxuella thermophila]SEN78057.1 Sigma-70, region 4 [Lihuaxuella thermophila]SEN80525.1 Sigma-70, region 4 [Lihuaxuella thermophila]
MEKLYSDLCTEIDILTLRIKDLEMEYKFWYRACFGNRSFPLDICLKRMEEICDQVEMYSTLLEEKEKTRKEIEKRMSEFEGLEYKVSYLRDVKGMTLAEIAAELGYSYIWIKQISARTRKKKHTKNILSG